MTKRLVVLMTIVLFVLSLATVYAQAPKKDTGEKEKEFPKLTAEQKDKMAKICSENRKAIIPLKADLEVKQIEMKELLRNDASQADLYKKIDEISAVQAQIKKQQIDKHLKMKGILTSEQKAFLKDCCGNKCMGMGMGAGCMKMGDGCGEGMGSGCMGMGSGCMKMREGCCKGKDGVQRFIKRMRIKGGGQGCGMEGQSENKMKGMPGCGMGMSLNTDDPDDEESPVGEILFWNPSDEEDVIWLEGEDITVDVSGNCTKL